MKKCYILYAARDKYGLIDLFKERPHRGYSIWIGDIFSTLPKSVFPDIKWEDKKPRKVKISIEED